jgi:glycosyltransferase involved in cell wall biosynthesis
MNPSDFLVFNDFVKRGRFGERTLWTYLVEDLGLPYVDFEKLKANSWYEAKLNLAARGKDAPKVGIQNATWAHPNTCGATKNIVILQDNILRAWNDPVPQTPTLEAADVIVCNGPLIAEDYARFDRPKGKIRVIPIGIDTEFWVPRGWKHDFNYPRVVFVGDEAPHKGYEVIAALARKRRDLDWSFVLKHRDQHDEALGKSYVAVSADVVRAVVQSADVFILGSPVETQCLAALEAMACGLPVVMPPTGCFHDWRPDSFFPVHGATVAAFDEALSLAIGCLGRPLLDPRGDLLAAERFTIPAMLASWRALLEEVAAGA